MNIFNETGPKTLGNTQQRMPNREVATEILRRSLQFDFPPLTEDELVLSAEELFLELDKRESEDG